MKKYLITAIVALLSVVVFQTFQLEHIKKEAERNKANTETLLADVQTYKTSDSLNCARAGVLELELKEYAKHRANDLQLIKQLETKNRNLQSVASTGTRTIVKLSGEVRDSIIYIDRYTRDTIKALNISDPPWFSINGIEKDGRFEGEFINCDSLLIVESVKYKRFLGFLWKTGKVKDRRVDVVSRNPHTKIENVSFVHIVK